MKKVVGYVDVDAGIVQVGDPCYTLTNERRRHDDRVTLTQEAYDKLLSLIPGTGILKTAVDEIRAESDKQIEEEDRFNEDGVNYSEMIDRLIDPDDIRLKISPEQRAAMKRAREEAGLGGYSRSEWDEPVVTSLAPPPEDRDGVTHVWQGVYQPYGQEPPMPTNDAHKGAGLVVSSGFGDGSYPVEIEWDDSNDEYWGGREPVTMEHNGEVFVVEQGKPPSVFHRIKSVKVTFISDEDGEEDD